MWWHIFKVYRNIKRFSEGHEERIWSCVAWYRQYHCIQHVPKGRKIPKCHANGHWNNEIPITWRGSSVNFQKTMCTETDSVGAGLFWYRTQSTTVQMTLVPNQPSLQCVPGPFPNAVKRPWSCVDHPPPLVSRLRIGTVMPVFLTLSAWHVTSIHLS